MPPGSNRPAVNNSVNGSHEKGNRNPEPEKACHQSLVLALSIRQQLL